MKVSTKKWLTIGCVAFGLFTFAFYLCGCNYEIDKKESGNSDPDRDPRICVTLTGVSLFDVNAGLTAWWFDGEKCDTEYDRQGRIISQDCGYGELELEPNTDLKQCLDVTDSAVPEQNLQYGFWHACSGYVSGHLKLTQDAELELPVVAEGFCKLGVPDCGRQPMSLLGQPFSDGRIVHPGYSVEDCCEYPGTSVQEVCQCPREWLVCDSQECQCIIDPEEVTEETGYLMLYGICIADGWSPLLCCETFYVAAECPQELRETCDPIYAAEPTWTNPCNPAQ